MKTFADAIEAAERVSTHAEKFAALKGIHHSQTRLIHEACNKYRRFNVKKWNEPNRYAKEDPVLMTEFYGLLDALHDRRLTGNEARESVTRVLGQYTKRTAKYLTRVLKKDLDCGANGKTFRKIYPEVDIPNFKLMFAKKMESKFKWKFPCIAEVKYNGLRLIAFADPEELTVSYVSRSGRQSDFCNGLFDKELIKMAQVVGQSIVVDGEVLGESFQETAKAKGKKRKTQKEQLRFYAFDMMTGHEWTTHKSRKIQVERSLDLSRLCRDLELKMVIKSEAKVVESVEEATAYYDRVVNENPKDQNEGLIIKDPEAFYTWDRVSAWTKWKPDYTVDLTIKKVHPGKGKFAETMGTVDCEGEDENGNKIEVAVGGGYKDDERDYFWHNRRILPGKTMEIKHFGMMLAENSTVYGLRHPQFVRLREDK